MEVTRQFTATKAFIVRDGKVLLLQESTDYEEGSNAGRWDVPGGRVKIGEHFSDSLKREVMEETGLTITNFTPIHIDEWRPTVKG